MAETSKKKLTCRLKRFKQNMRTYQRIQKQRAARAKRMRFNSVEEMEKQLGIKRWTTAPVSQAKGQLLK